MDMTSPEMTEILEAILIKDDPARRRARLLELWAELLPAGRTLQLCALGHVLADTEADVADELEWDLRALEAATGSREAEDRGPLPPVPESYLPSLHLSVGEGYRKLGDLWRAQQHLLLATNHVSALPDDAYGNMVKGGLKRLRGALAVNP